MKILVDTDNVPQEFFKGGILDLISATLKCYNSNLIANSNQINFKLYGGWYENNRPTQKAQRLIAELESFPKPVLHSIGNKIQQITISIELAYSLEICPSKHFFNTYRPRKSTGNFNCKPPTDLGCVEPDCALLNLNYFVNNNACPKSACSISPTQLFYKNQQKLVDSMIVADLIFLSHSNSDTIGIITSDDDIWPGIQSAISFGAKIHHIHTIKNRTTSPLYSRGLSAYSQSNLWES